MVYAMIRVSIDGLERLFCLRGDSFRIPEYTESFLSSADRRAVEASSRSLRQSLDIFRPWHHPVCIMRTGRIPTDLADIIYEYLGGHGRSVLARVDAFYNNLRPQWRQRAEKHCLEQLIDHQLIAPISMAGKDRIACFKEASLPFLKADEINKVLHHLLVVMHISDEEGSLIGVLLRSKNAEKISLEHLGNLLQYAVREERLNVLELVLQMSQVHRDSEIIHAVMHYAWQLRKPNLILFIARRLKGTAVVTREGYQGILPGVIDEGEFRFFDQHGIQELELALKHQIIFSTRARMGELVLEILARFGHLMKRSDLESIYRALKGGTRNVLDTPDTPYVPVAVVEQPKERSVRLVVKERVKRILEGKLRLSNRQIKSKDHKF